MALVPPENKAWLNRFGSELRRVMFEDENQTAHIRDVAKLLSETVWQRTPGLEIVPYLDGIPAGTAQKTDAVWLEKTLYVEDRSIAKLASIVSQELGRIFGLKDMVLRRFLWS